MSMSTLPMGSRMPVAKTPVRYAHVAHFVGLSLLRDPNLARPKVAKSASMPQVHVPEPDEADLSASQSVSSLPSLSVERVDQLRCQINWLKAERRAEKEQLKKLEHSLSESVVQEKVAHQRAQGQRQKRDEHVSQLKDVEHKMYQIKIEARDKGGSRPGTSGADGNATIRADEPGLATSQMAQAQNVQDAALSRSLPPGSLDGTALDVLARESQQSNKDQAGTMKLVDPLATSLDMFENDAELANYRRSVIRKELMSRAEKRADPTKWLLGGRAVTFFEMRRGLIDQKLSEDEMQGYWQHLDLVEESNVIEAFHLINLSGSGRICSNDFADGVARVGVQWQKLTGLKRPKDLFRLFDCDKDGVITLFELFPTERHKKKKEDGHTTPEFWKTYVKSNPAKQFEPPAVCGTRGRHAPWSTGVANDGLAIMEERQRKDADAAWMRKWQQTTMRRMKGNGKSDARVREMCSFHLPKGTGPKDRQEVATFSDTEVKQCRREYSDAVMEPQRVILKELFELRELRKELSVSRQKLWHVAMEPQLKQQALDEQKNIAKSMGLGLKLHHEEPEQAPDTKKAPVLDMGLKSMIADMNHDAGNI